MKLIHISPIDLMSVVDKQFNKGHNMLLTHLVLNNERYREEAKKLSGIKFLDNSFFELGYCMKPDEMMEAAELVNATHLICPDGTADGLKEFKEAGYKVMCIPTSATQFEHMMYNDEIDMVAVSEEHLDYRHSPSARYELFRDYLKDDMPKKKIHILGATDSIWELGMLSPFKEFIYSWDSSACIWQGYLGNLLRTQKRKDCTPVDFDTPCELNLMMLENIKFVEELVNG